MALGNGSSDGLYTLLETDIENEDRLERVTSLQATQASKFILLMKNLDMLEEMFADSNAVRLETEILEQLQRLGALRLFDSCLSRTLKFDLSRVNDSVDEHVVVDKVFVQSGKKELRKLRRKRTLDKETISNDLQHLASARRTSKSRNKRQKTARNEAEMSSGVKVVSVSYMQ